jgi:hypothetical protein
MQKGQTLDAFFTLNLNPRLNFSIAYKGLRSEGNYINQLSSTGILDLQQATTQKRRYFANAHFTSQDILNEENGGITTISDFEDEDPNYDNRQRLQVYFTDAKSFLKGKRVFLDHFLRVNDKKELTIYTSAINLITKINFLNTIKQRCPQQ